MGFKLDSRNSQLGLWAFLGYFISLKLPKMQTPILLGPGFCYILAIATWYNESS